MNDVLLGTKIKQWIDKGASPVEMEEMMVVQFLVSRLGRKGMVTVTDGETVFQCVKSIPGNAQPMAQPKKKKGVYVQR